MTSFIRTLVALFLGAITGCGGGTTPRQPEDGPAILVLYQSNPVANVNVQLRESEDGPVLARAITSASGHARFVNLPSPEPNEYFVVLESVSDGGWILNPKVMQQFTPTLRMKPLAQSTTQLIELPNRSIQSLHNKTR